MGDRALERGQARDDQTGKHEPEHADVKSPAQAAAWQAYVSGLQKGANDDLADLTASQSSYVENLRAIEKANPKATTHDVAMALSMVLWQGRLWEKDGKAADVATPAEARDNERAVQIAEEAGTSGEALSVLMTRHFRQENAEEVGLDV